MSSIIPYYFCDHCGHAFNHPENRGKGIIMIGDIEAEDFDERCPRCGNPDYELLINENDDRSADKSVSSVTRTLASGLHISVT